ncbi:MAG: hypothetical protein GC185_09430 [Alphaproteobacteria bacterium]|nr:hypothetical protein [Alphaproteobacteria bacterium]
MKLRKNILSPFGILLLIFSLAYIGAEAVFNMRLLDVAGTVRSDPDALKNLQYFGRSVSAFGFTLLVLGVFEIGGFELATRRQWATAMALALLCLGPFIALFIENIATLYQTPGVPSYQTHFETYEMTLCFVPLLGLAFVCGSGGFRRWLVILGLVCLAWPAMFLGQKLLIERYLIDQTTWSQRQDARSMLMLRSGLEDGIMQLGDLQLHDAGAGVADMKAARIVMSAIWMLHPARVLQDLQRNRDALVENAAANGTWFSTANAYKKYVSKVTSERNAYQQELMDKYYTPYKQASGMYADMMDAAYLDKEAEKARQQVEDGIDDGWRRYKDAVNEMRQSVTTVVSEAMRGSAAASRLADSYCATHDCPDVDISKSIDALQQKAETKFYVRTGYHSDIRDRATFVAQKKTQREIRKQVEEQFRTRFGQKDFTLPDDWTYEPESFKKSVKKMMREQAHVAWRRRFGDKLPPGLGPDEFAAAMGVQIPSVDELLMPPDQFFQKYVLPGNQRMVDSMISDLRADREKYPADMTTMEEGKEYADALYIPTISLVVSLSVVMMTLLRGLLAGVALVYLHFQRVYNLQRWMLYGAQGVVGGCFIAFLLALPRIAPNPYASGEMYHRYLADAEKVHPVPAHILDWAVQVQPVIYRFGMEIRRAAGQ